jgi:hypothetical protein
MDKSDYLAKAPIYYALALAVAIDQFEQAPLTIRQMNEALSDDYQLLRTGLIERGAAILEENGVIEILRDDFGPTLFVGRPDLGDWMSGAATKKYPLFKRFKDIGSDVSWLLAALARVNERYVELGVRGADFDPATSEPQWEPIPLERDDAALQKAAESLDVAIAEIEGDNGYAVHAPGERDYVLTGLKAIRKVLSENVQIYWMQIDTFALKPLQLVISRFGSAAVGIAASAARAALVEWLKGKIGHFFG